MEDTGIAFGAVQVHVVMVGKGDGGTAYAIWSKVVLGVLRVGRGKVGVERDLVTCVVTSKGVHKYKCRGPALN